ncbi:ATP-dependent RNA helicase DbpA [Brackiella oedipodis]|uniref:ATP-dependent RNA helicase DbpA n=1 Tax=Brackiella oedipodis TaxID=124225 RepID=UPI0005719EFC|nr:ATP-dependent RNA helicase DbpA [Brackiella oedipodis]
MSTASTVTHFQQLPLPEAQRANLQQLGFTQMTPIQCQTLPSILQGKDVIAKAPTGSGKTLAFGLGIMQKLQLETLQIQALVLCPTRELAAQVADVLRDLARPLGAVKIIELCGGSGLGPQIHSLRYGAHVVVGTPGRVLDLLQRDELRLNQVKTLILDEADRMLDMGFYEPISAISLACPLKRQTLLFSATFAPALLKQSEGFLINPLFVDVSEQSPAPAIQQRFYKTTEDQRFSTAKKLLLAQRPESCLVFCNTIAQAESFQHYLQHTGLLSLVLHGDLEQRQRQDILVQFANKSCSVLIATDVAARGLDIEQLDLVLSLDISPNLDTHTHRIGRTGRRGQKGLAFNLVTDAELHRAQRLVGQEQSIAWQNLPATHHKNPYAPAMRTICIKGGKKDKIRAGDILGTLTKDLGLAGDQVGKITIFDFVSFVAVPRPQAPNILQKLLQTTIKNKHLKARLMQ